MDIFSPFSIKSEQCDLGTVAIFCELPEDLYCKENECFQHCCPRDYFYDPEKEICDQLSGDLHEQWENKFNAALPHEDLDFGIVTNIYGEYLEIPDLSCDEDDAPIEQDLAENYVKFLPNGKIDIDGAIIPFGEHCYNQQGNNYSGVCTYLINKWLGLSILRKTTPKYVLIPYPVYYFH